MSEQEERQARLALADAVEQVTDVGDQFVHRPHKRPFALRTAVASQVEGVDSVAVAHQPLGDVLVAAAVLRVAVDKDDGRAGRATPDALE